MIDKIFSLLQAQPLVSIILGFLLAGFLAWILKDQIRLYVKKRYDLYDTNEIKDAVVKANDERFFYKNISDKLTPTIEDRVITFLKNK